MTRYLALAAVLVWGVPTAAQQSDSFTLSDWTFDSGGEHALASGTYAMTLVGIGETMSASGAGGLTLTLEDGFGACYPPPGEVQGLVLIDRATLAWDYEASIGNYNLYRGELADLVMADYGDCLGAGLLDETAIDSTPPPAGGGFIYLVTARNRLGEEGNRGFTSYGALRPAANVCP